MLRTKRVYEPATRSDGHRVLVDRLWPRGVRKEEAAVSEWMKDIAPSPELRRWFGHDPERWPEFKRRYRAELQEKAALVDAVAERASGGTVTLLYGARDEVHNHAAVLAAVVRPRLAKSGKAVRPSTRKRRAQPVSTARPRR